MNDTEYRPLTVGNWILTFILLAIPLVNIIMLIVWAVGDSTHPSKKSYAQATLIIIAVAIVIGIGVGVLGAIFGHGMGSMNTVH